MIGPGKYDRICTLAKWEAQAQGAIVIIIEGAHGSGFSVQAPLAIQTGLPELLRTLATQIERDLSNPSDARSQPVNL